MKKRSIAAVILLSLVTFGIYMIIWTVQTKNEMNQQGASIPTAWLILVPIVNLWWMWKYCQGVDHATAGKLSTAVAFLLLFLIPLIGMAIIQDGFNNAAQRGVLPVARAV